MEAAAKSGLTCLVTIHGIGFQQPPDDALGIWGYADGLHQHLSEYLTPSVLSDDPGRIRDRPGKRGPIYVTSNWPANTADIEQGLKRVGTWKTSATHEIEVDEAPLGPGPVVHVAVVYSRLEDRVPRLGSAIQTLSRGAVSFGHYASIASAAHLILDDAWASLHHAQPQSTAPSSLRVRSDLAAPHAGVLSGILHPAAPAPNAESGLVSTLHHLEQDLAAYVARNDMRERVKGFVREVLLRLAFRDDVSQIIVNSHSHGTVVAFDVLRELSYSAIPKVKAFVTAGSPLRKYSDMFAWGSEVGWIKAIPAWANFWDAHDPVADPLSPAQDWQPGTDPSVPAGALGMYQALDPNGGVLEPVPIQDRKVDNLLNSPGGGLPAHNYWDNVPEFVQPLGEIVKAALRVEAQPVTRPVTVLSGSTPQASRS